MIDDVAVLELTSPVDGIQPANITSVPPGLQGDALLVGFGSIGGIIDKAVGVDFSEASYARNGILRTGAIEFSQCPSDIKVGDAICSRSLFPSIEAIACKGDSGGGLFLMVDGGTLVGVTSYEWLSTPSCSQPLLTSFTNLFTKRDWVLSRVAARNHNCGRYSCLSDGNILTRDREYVVYPEHMSRKFQVDVREKFSRLLITVNAPSIEDDEGEMLELKLSGPCDDLGRSFLACEVPLPHPSSLNIEVSSAKGSGPFQLSVVGFRERRPIH